MACCTCLKLRKPKGAETTTGAAARKKEGAAAYSDEDGDDRPGEQRGARELSTSGLMRDEARWRETAFAAAARRLRMLKSAEGKPMHLPRDYALVNDDYPESRFDIKNFRLTWGKASKYDIHWNKPLGEGAFGAVYRAENRKTGALCVAKTIKQDKERHAALQQEVKMLELLRDGPNIIQLLDTIKLETGMKALMFELVPNPKYRKSFRRMDDVEARNYLYQLLLALNYCHSQGVIHRDVKSGNVLYDPATRTLRLIDLGFCAFYMPSCEWASWPGTRSYKAPELFLHYKYYDYASDVWSFACIMGQIVLQRKSMFESDRAGDDHELGSLNHMIAVCKALGTRDYATFLAKYGSALGMRGKYPFALFRKERCKSSRVNWSMLVNRHNKHLAVPDAIDLLDQLLVYDHEKRLTSREALLHRYFNPVRTVEYSRLIRSNLLGSAGSAAGGARRKAGGAGDEADDANADEDDDEDDEDEDDDDGDDDCDDVSGDEDNEPGGAVSSDDATDADIDSSEVLASSKAAAAKATAASAKAAATRAPAKRTGAKQAVRKRATLPSSSSGDREGVVGTLLSSNQDGESSEAQQ